MNALVKCAELDVPRPGGRWGQLMGESARADLKQRGVKDADNADSAGHAGVVPSGKPNAACVWVW